MGLFSSPQGLCCLDFSLLVFGLSQLGPLPLALDFLQMGSLFSLRSYMRLDSTLLLYGCSVLVARLNGLWRAPPPMPAMRFRDLYTWVFNGTMFVLRLPQPDGMMGFCGSRESKT